MIWEPLVSGPQNPWQGGLGPPKWTRTSNQLMRELQVSSKSKIILEGFLSNDFSMRVHLPPNLKTLISKLVCLECEELTHQNFKREGNKFSSRQVLAEWKILSWNSANGLSLCPCQRHRGARWGLALTCRCVLFSSQNNFKFLEISYINVVWGLLCKIRSSSRNRPIHTPVLVTIFLSCLLAVPLWWATCLSATAPTFFYYPFSCAYYVLCLTLWVFEFEFPASDKSQTCLERPMK